MASRLALRFSGPRVVKMVPDLIVWFPYVWIRTKRRSAGIDAIRPMSCGASGAGKATGSAGLGVVQAGAVMRTMAARQRRMRDFMWLMQSIKDAHFVGLNQAFQAVLSSEEEFAALGDALDDSFFGATGRGERNPVIGEHATLADGVEEIAILAANLVAALNKMAVFRAMTSRYFFSVVSGLLQFKS